MQTVVLSAHETVIMGLLKAQDVEVRFDCLSLHYILDDVFFSLVETTWPEGLMLL